MKKHVLGFATAALIALAAPAAHAATFINLPAAAADGSITAAFGKTGVKKGFFSHTYNFLFPASGFASVDVSSVAIKSKPTTNIDFTKVTFNGALFQITNGVFDFATLQDQAVSAGLQTLVIEGKSGGNGSYSVDVAYAPVPEPATWALLIAGLSCVGGVVRQSRRNRVLA